ncbi:MAG: hydrogenase expression/formation protein HypE [bacterium]|nr:hydrogenase expression/formation protein HypE [bacterium]
MKNPDPTFPSCPTPISRYDRIVMGHGGGGRLTHNLIDDIFIPAFNNSILRQLTDSAVLQVGEQRLAFTTDSYVVHPLFFPGGDIGSLAVNGTVNDLAMSGARPLYLSAGCILEEGLPLEDLKKIVDSMQRAAAAAKVQLVTGDTKVVDRGRGDGIYINTAGIGVIEHDLKIAPSQIQPGDAILLNGDIGRHGVAVMASRAGLSFETTIESDCAPLADLVLKLIDAGVEIHCLRDLTRGGLATALIELAASAQLGMELQEAAIPVREDVSGACEIMGFDPLYVANEGRLVCILPDAAVDQALKIMRAHPQGQGAALIGRVSAVENLRVILKNRIGTRRILDLLSGEQLPRIC